MTSVREMLNELFTGKGLAGLAFDSNGVAGIQFDDLPVNIHVDEEAGEITLFVCIGDIPDAPEAKLAAYAYLLKANNFARQTGGGILGIDNMERHAYFSYRFLIEELTTARLEEIVEAFLNLAEAFTASYRNLGSQAGERAIAGPVGAMRA